MNKNIGRKGTSELGLTKEFRIRQQTQANKLEKKKTWWKFGLGFVTKLWRDNFDKSIN